MQAVQGDGPGEPHVVVIDPLPMYGLGLRTMLSAAGFVVQDGSDSPDLDGTPQVTVLVLRDDDSWGRLERLRGRSEVVAVVADLSAAPRAIKAGASSVVVEDCPPDALALAVAAAAIGLTVVPRQAACLFQRSGAPSDRMLVSAEERGWLLALSQGCTVAEIARTLAFSEREMHRRLARVYRRMGAKRRIEAITLAERWGLLDEASISCQVADAHLSLS